MGYLTASGNTHSGPAVTPLTTLLHVITPKVMAPTSWLQIVAGLPQPWQMCPTNAPSCLLWVGHVRPKPPLPPIVGWWQNNTDGFPQPGAEPAAFGHRLQLQFCRPWILRRVRTSHRFDQSGYRAPRFCIYRDPPELCFLQPSQYLQVVSGAGLSD